MNTFSVIWIGLITIVFCLPFTPAAVPWNDEFDWSAVNYAPLVTGGVMLAIGLWWWISAHKTFTGPRHTYGELDQEVVPTPKPEFSP